MVKNWNRLLLEIVEFPWDIQTLTGHGPERTALIDSTVLVLGANKFQICSPITAVLWNLSFGSWSFKCIQVGSQAYIMLISGHFHKQTFLHQWRYEIIAQIIKGSSYLSLWSTKLLKEENSSFRGLMTLMQQETTGKNWGKDVEQSHRNQILSMGENP